MVGHCSKDWNFLAAAGLSLILGGCSLLSTDKPSPERPPPTVAKPPSPPATSVRPQPEAAKPPRSPSSPTPVTKPDPAELMGMSEADVHYLLGSPHDEHSEGAARVQTYVGGGCTLDIVLFLDVSRSEWSVLSYDLTSPSGKRALETCYGQMQAKR